MKTKKPIFITIAGRGQSFALDQVTHFVYRPWEKCENKVNVGWPGLPSTPKMVPELTVELSSGKEINIGFNHQFRYNQADYEIILNRIDDVRKILDDNCTFIIVK
jgi:hypothetical protein